MNSEMIDIQALLEKVNLLKYVSQYSTFEKIGNEYWCCSPLNPNDKTPSFSINADDNIFYCFSTGKGGNIINFIMEYNNVTFTKALEMLIEYVGGNINKLPKTAVLTNIYRKFKKQDEIQPFVTPLKLNPNIMDKYIKKPIKEWLNEGISQKSLDKYQVRYDLNDNRIVFPIWDNEGNIISVSGRTLNPNYKEMKIRKYIYYGSIGTTHFLYGYWQNKDEILSKNEILIFEGAKSVMKSEDYGYSNVIASMTDNFSYRQIEELIKTSVKDVVICWDKEVTTKEIRKRLGILLKYKNCYAVFDSQGLLEPKMSPVDKGKNTWELLYNNRTRLK